MQTHFIKYEIFVHTSFRDEIWRLCDFFDGKQNVIVTRDINIRHWSHGALLPANLGSFKTLSNAQFLL